jgi:hypothetical protein
MEHEMDEFLKKLVDAPLKSATKINLPMGRKPATRAPRQPHERREGDLTLKEVRERKAASIDKKRSALLDYYAGTDVPAQRVAEHLGIFRSEECGVDEETGKPIINYVLDVEGVEAALRQRRGK